MKNMLTKSLLTVGAASLLFVACKKEEEESTPPPAQNSIYTDLGGSAMVEDPNNPGTNIEQGYLTLRSVVDSTIFVIAADNDLNGYFAPLLAEVGAGDLSGFAALSASFTNFLAVATGSNSASYTGMGMVEAHSPLTNGGRNQYFVNDAAFTNFIGAVVTGAGKNGVPSDAPIIARIGALLETLRPQIVQTENSISQQTVYERLGGSTMVSDPNNPGAMIERGALTIRSVVDSTIFIIAADSRLNTEYFSVLLDEVGGGDLTGFAALSASLTNFFAAGTGSVNIQYTGLNMADAHNPQINSRMGNTADDAAMNAFIEDVVAGAAKNGVPATDLRISEIGAVLESLRGDVVQR